MKEERMATILGMVDEKYIEEAAPVPQKKIVAGRKMRKEQMNGLKRACRVAAIILAAGISVYALRTFVGPDTIVAPGTEQMTEYTATGQEEMPGTEAIKETSTTEQRDSHGQGQASENDNTPTHSSEQETTANVTTESDELPTEVSEQEEPQYHEDGREMLSAELHSGDMGFEGLMFYNIFESGSLNPWTREAEVKVLPVFRNLSYDGGPGYAIWLTEAELLLKAEQTAVKLGVEIEAYEYQYPSQYARDIIVEDRERVYAIRALTELGEIRVEGNGSIRIRFEEAITLPKEYHFTWHGTTEEEANEVMHYLLQQYEGLHGFQQPVVGSWGDYSFQGVQKREYEAFEGNGSLEEQILNYNFASLKCSPDSEGKLKYIWLGNKLESAEKIGDYPIISWEDAQSLLLNGDYITTVPVEYLEDGTVKEGNIAKVELIYRSGSYDKVYMPYYRFFVELTGRTYGAHFKIAEGLESYGVFYVPAVSGEYLTDFPVWGGEFN
ncbi:MAG: hypothetical protein IJZ84_05145 [Lachnospiraceae bacterium]|nr:hypothetical protein [Lachnospiraceae bacterium]